MIIAKQVSQTALFQDNRVSLFIVLHTSIATGIPDHSTVVDDIGFSTNWKTVFSYRHQSTKKALNFFTDFNVLDRYFTVVPADCSGRLGELEIMEEYLYDLALRGEVDITGLSIILKAEDETRRLL